MRFAHTTKFVLFCARLSYHIFMWYNPYMKFTKTQVNTLLALGGVTVILFVGMFFLPWVNPAFAENPPGPEIPTETPPPHNPFRGPRPAADPFLEWEINLGGSGDETVVAAFGLTEEIIIFGNTTSNDYDFESTGAGAFAVLISFDGRPIAYFTFEGVLERVVPLDNGFLLCINTETESFLIETDALGIEIRRIDLQRGPNERIIDVYIDYFAEIRTPPGQPLELFHAVMEYTNPFDGYKELRVHVLTDEFEDRFQRFFRRAQSLEYVAAYAHAGGFYLFANLRGFNESVLTFYNWTRGTFTETSFDNLILPLIPFYTVDAVIPAGLGRYISLIRTENNIPFLIDSYQDFRRNVIRPLSNVPVRNVRLMAGANMFYVYEYQIGDRSVLWRFDHDDLRIADAGELREFTNLIALDTHIITRFGTLFCGRTVDSVQIIGTNERGVNFTRSFLSRNETINTMIETPRGLILIGESTGVGINVGGNFGGSDIWVSKLLF